jgi:hypothetical protein
MPESREELEQALVTVRAVRAIAAEIKERLDVLEGKPAPTGPKLTVIRGGDDDAR